MKSVVICGSKRFKADIEKFSKVLKDKGVIVFAPYLNTNRKIDTLPEDLKKYAFLGLTLHHFEYIRKADVVLIFNKGGYIGNSVTLELGVAAGLSKPIYALSGEDDDESRKVLFDEVVKSPRELLKRLK